MKPRDGYVIKPGAKSNQSKNRWLARITYTDLSGKRRNVVRRCATKTEANLKLKELAREIARDIDHTVDVAKITFAHAAEAFVKAKLFEAEYRDGKKIGGVRSLTPLSYVPVLLESFGRRKLRSITHGDVEDYKRMRISTPTRKGTERAIASVNRELELLRQIFNYAKRQAWLERSPFDFGDALIVKSAEVSRERTLSDEEEVRLLAVCYGRLAHLRPIIITAVDSGLRRGEMFKLTWADVDFVSKTITLPMLITKTLRSRSVGMTDRMCDELLSLYEESDKQRDSLVFGITDNVKNSWYSACRRAGIEDLRLHDLRHTYVSRLITAGIPAAEAMKLSGHATAAMMWKYLNPDACARRRAAEALEGRRTRLEFKLDDKVN